VLAVSKTNAKRWGEERERHLLQHGPPAPTEKEVPTLQEFAPRFIDGHAKANRRKPKWHRGAGDDSGRNTWCRRSAPDV